MFCLRKNYLLDKKIIDMSADFNRTDRISSTMQKALSKIIRDEVKDPRVGMITVQAVRTVRDLSQAKVYFTVIPDTDRKQAELALNKAAGFIRHQLGKAISLRNTPELHFVYDTSIEEGSRLHALIENTVRKDTESGNQD